LDLFARGPGAPVAERRELARSKRVRFVGAVEDVPAFLAPAALYVQPSRWEGFPNAVLEAMAAGKAVVASRVGGLLETVRDGQTGYLVPWRCPEPFAERLDLVLGNRALGRSLGGDVALQGQGHRIGAGAHQGAAVPGGAAGDSP
jgi:glycosyltransferase involved in cell wall biosynthesis